MGIKKNYEFFILFYFCCIELSHRSTAFGKIIQDAERDVRELL